MANGFGKFVDIYENQVKEYVKNIEDDKSQIQELMNDLARDSEIVGKKVTGLFQQLDSDNPESIYSQIICAKAAVEDRLEHLNDLYNDFFNADPEGRSRYSHLLESLEHLQDRDNQVSQLLMKIDESYDRARLTSQDIKKYHAEVYGEDGNGGFKERLNSYEYEIKAFFDSKKQDFEKHEATIRDLLQLASTSGLASAYSAQKREYRAPIIFQSTVFTVSLACLLVLGGYNFFNAIKGTLATDPLSALISVFVNVLNQSMVALPLIWLAVFSSRRRNELIRLEQEYVHKYAMTMSFEGFKEQISKLGKDGQEMEAKLLEATIDVVSRNASVTLDKNRDESTPLKYVVDELLTPLEKLKALLYKEK